MIVEVWQRVMDLAKTGTSGMDSEDEFNGKVKLAQNRLAELLKDVDEENERASQALSWLKKDSGALTTSSDGSLTMPTDFSSLITVTLLKSGSRYPGTKYRNNEVDTVRTSPILAPDLSLNEIGFYNRSGKVFIMPEAGGTAVDMLYYIKVPNATINLQPSQTDDADLVIPAVGTDFGWPEFCFNLLVYAILEQLGIEIREDMLFEYARFGISEEMIKTSPQ